MTKDRDHMAMNKRAVRGPWTAKLIALTASLVLICTVGLTAGFSTVASAAGTLNWNQLTPDTSPTARSNAAMATDGANGTVVLFGGLDSAGAPQSDTWTWNGSDWAAQDTTGPSARSGASMAYDSESNQLLLFGGRAANGTALNDTWTWNGTSWTQLTPDGSPPARFGASMAYDPSISEVVLFGGDTAGKPLNDTWAWNGTSWTQITGTAPPARHSAAFAFDPTSTDMILFGGCTLHIFNQPCANSGVAATLGDTWSFDGSTWTQLTPTSSPSARSAAVMATDTATPVNQPVLFGGWDFQGNQQQDTWIWNGTDWTQPTLTPPGMPSGRHAQGMAYDEASGDLLLFGGADGVLNDTWDFVSTVTPTPTTTSLASSANPQAVNQSVTFTATVAPTPDGGTVNFKNGATTITGCGAAIVTDGTATCTTTFPATGTFPITAVYSGDADFAGSTSPVLDQVITAAAPTPTTTAISSSVNPSTAGSIVNFPATVTPTPDGGTVTFKNGATTIPGCSASAECRRRDVLDDLQLDRYVPHHRVVLRRRRLRGIHLARPQPGRGDRGSFDHP